MTVGARLVGGDRGRQCNGGFVAEEEEEREREGEVGEELRVGRGHAVAFAVHFCLVERKLAC